jgi:hypothetical protein
MGLGLVVSALEPRNRPLLYVLEQQSSQATVC